MRRLTIALFILMAAEMSVSQTSSSAKTQSTITFTRASGGSIQTILGYGIIVNKESSLTREWIAMHDTGFPVDLVETPGIVTAYEQNRVSGDYRYKTNFMIDVKESISAIEIRFLTFDIWGQHVRNLSLSEIRDVRPGQIKLSGEWNLYSENECSDYYASIAYISRIRKANGQVIASDPSPVIQEAKKFSNKFSAADLEPKPEIKR